MRRATRQERGIALVTTLWVSLLLALTVVTVASAVRTESGARRNSADLVRAREAALAGVHLAMHEIVQPVAARAMPRDGRPVMFEFGGAVVSIVIEDERGKLDLRLAPPQSVQALLRTLGGRAGIDTFDSVNLAQTITLALQATHQGDERRARVHAMSALAALPGMPAEFAGVLDRHATIFGFGAQINPMRASREVLGSIEGLDARTAAEIIAAREDGRPRPAAGRAEPLLTNLEGPVYTIRATGQIANGIAGTVTAVVANEGVGLGARVGRIAILELR